MSEEDLFHHHSFLEEVARNDVAELLEKDRSYRASWKKRGGTGAFMMLARKWDRLEAMLGNQYNLFQLIEDQKGLGQGSDGTVLAEVRDLRRYLLLVEAEMQARGAVEFAVVRPSANWARVAQATVQDDDACSILAIYWQVTREEARRRVLAQLTPRVPRLLRADDGLMTPGDGSHHALADRLEDGVDEDPRSSIYLKVPGQPTRWIVDRRLVPQELWDHLPRLRREVNHKERSELPAWYQLLYVLDPASNDQKYRLGKPWVAHWGKE
jgi:hypothetical protein